MGKYFFIGGINEGGLPRGGAEAKNQFLLKKFQEIYIEQLDYIDMTSSRMNVLFRYLKLIKGLINHQHIILSVASTALEKLAYLNFYLKKKNLTIFIIGGVVDQKLINPRMKKLFENAHIAYAETEALTQNIKYKSSRINVKHLPNFKDLIDFSPINKSNKDGIIKFVFLSRVHRAKGVFRAIEVVQYLNESIKEKIFVIDIYGPIDLSAEDKKVFGQQIESQYINYKGYINLSNPEAYSELSATHFFIFLTNHPGEGFPGVLIDALHSGTIIIASNWKYNNEIVPQSNLLVDLEVNYKELIKDYINQVLTITDKDFQNLILQQKEQAQKYDINNIDFKIS